MERTTHLDGLCRAYNRYGPITLEVSMFDAEDRAYFGRRAEAEKARAQTAQDATIKKIHEDLAAEYERRARGEEPRTLKRLPI